MPPKAALRRPAGAGPIGRRAVRGGAGAKALARAKAGVRRPASAAEETPGVEGDSEIFQRGEAVEAYKLPLETWKSGTHIAITKGIYWEEEVQVAGRVEGLATKKDQVTLSFRLEGTKNESLVKWSGSHPGVALEVDICQPGCSLISKDGLLHCRVIQKVLDSTRAAWMNNLVAAETPMGAEDELRRLRLREKELAKRKRTEDDKGVGEPQEDTLSGSSEDAKKKRKKKKKKDKVRVVGTKSPAALFATTALDPKPEVRRRVRRRARRLTKRRNKKESTGSSGSSSVTSDTGSSEADGARLFGEEVRVKKVWRKSPGALTLNTLEQMQLAVVTTSGQMWDLDRSSLPPIFRADERPPWQGVANALLPARLALAGQGGSCVRRGDPEAQRSGTDLSWRTLQHRPEAGVGAAGLPSDDNSNRSTGGQQDSARGVEGKEPFKSPLGKETRVGEEIRGAKGKRQDKGQRQVKGKRRSSSSRRSQQRGSREEVEASPECGPWVRGHGSV